MLYTFQNINSSLKVLTEIISGVVRKDYSRSGYSTTNPSNRNGGSGSGSDYDESDEDENENNEDEDEISTSRKLKEMEIIESWAASTQKNTAEDEEDDNISIG